MTYRIRYRRPDGPGESEMTIEAGSPNEAMVKFQCSMSGRPRANHEETITSVRAEESYQEI